MYCPEENVCGKATARKPHIHAFIYWPILEVGGKAKIRKPLCRLNNVERQLRARAGIRLTRRTPPQ